MESVIKAKANSKKIAVFDLDGCVSDDFWRRGRIPENASAADHYVDYHSVCDKDPVLDHGSAILKRHISQGDFIVFATARPFATAEKTAKWTTKHFGIYPERDFMLVMRADMDTRPSIDLKKEQAKFIGQFSKESGQEIIACYDDREDIAKIWREEGYNAHVLNSEGLFPVEAEPVKKGAEPGKPFAAILSDSSSEKPLARLTTADILGMAAETFRERNGVYKDNAKNVGLVMKALFPNGVVINEEADHHFYHLFELLIVKLTRFANSGLKHRDSIRDATVYAAMCESVIDQHNIEVR